MFLHAFVCHVVSALVDDVEGLCLVVWQCCERGFEFLGHWKALEVGIAGGDDDFEKESKHSICVYNIQSDTQFSREVRGCYPMNRLQPEMGCTGSRRLELELGRAIGTSF